MRIKEVTKGVVFSDIQLKKAFSIVEASLTKIGKHLHKLDEAITVPVEGDLDQQLAEITKRFDAAKRALGLVNRLPKGPQKTANARRVMQNINTLRAMLSRVTKWIEQYTRASNDYENADDLGSDVFPQKVAMGYEHEEQDVGDQETDDSWEDTPLASVMRQQQSDPQENEMCTVCFCVPCECGQEQDEEWCPDCDGYEHVLSNHPDMKQQYDEIPDENEEEDFTVCPKCHHKNCECCAFCGQPDCQCE